MNCLKFLSNRKFLKRKYRYLLIFLKLSSRSTIQIQQNSNKLIKLIGTSNRSLSSKNLYRKIMNHRMMNLSKIKLILKNSNNYLNLKVKVIVKVKVKMKKKKSKKRINKRNVCLIVFKD